VKRLCVFCGASEGSAPAYRQAAQKLGGALALRGIGLVYGGGHAGLMGAIADAALAAGGQVIGVIPRALLEREIAHTGLTELRVVESLHERKALMADLSVGFIALPGGFGTLDELCEVVTWRQLRLHAKPCAILNTERYFDLFLAMIEHARGSGFIAASTIENLIICDDVDELLDALADA
jgi:uncharacterized protein (TIGR00730 family)